MSMLILCTGRPLSPLDGSYTSVSFDAAVQALIDSASEAPAERPIAPAGRTVYIAEGKLARSTAEQILLLEDFQIEPLLNEIPLRSYMDTDRLLPAEKWLRKAAAQRKASDPRQPESRSAVLSRADNLIRKLESADGDSLLITYPLFLTELLDRLRVHNYVVQRSGIFKVQPLEKIVVSRKTSIAVVASITAFFPTPAAGSAVTKPCAGEADTGSARNTVAELAGSKPASFLSVPSNLSFPICSDSCVACCNHSLKNRRTECVGLQ